MSPESARMKKTLLLLSALHLQACTGAARAPLRPEVVPDPESAEARLEMCIEENIGVFRFSRAYLEGFCPSLKTQTELICLRFVHATKEWHKACPGVDTPDKLECISVIQNGPSYALLESLQKCRTVKNRRQVFCLSRKIANSGIPLPLETVQGCLDKN